MKVSDAASLLWADFIIYQTTMMIYVTILFLLRFGYYSAQSAWFNVILLGYAVNAKMCIRDRYCSICFRFSGKTFSTRSFPLSKRCSFVALLSCGSTIF